MALLIILGVLAHMVGDYVLQSNWMAINKLRRWWPAWIHGAAYTSPFVVVLAVASDASVGRELVALAVIGGTHAVLDRLAVASYVIYAKNHLAPRSAWPDRADIKANLGNPSAMPTYLSRFLSVVTDNTMHVLINTVALGWLA